MAKWKCEICGSEFENFHAQGFNHKIYCPLCFFKKKNQELKEQLKNYEKLGFKHLQDKNNNLETQQKEFIKYLEDEIYNIEPKGTRINYNCEYDSEEDYVNAMEEQSRLNTLKENLQKYKSIIGVFPKIKKEYCFGIDELKLFKR